MAIYTLTMGTPNMLNIYAVNGSGYATYDHQISTGGNGGSSGSEHSLIVYQNYIFACNPASDTLTMFSISSTDATSVTLVNTVATGFNWPNSVTAYGNISCVVTSGASNGVRCYNFNQNGLTIINNSDRNLGINLTTPPVFHTGPAQISFTLDGSALVISVKNTQPVVPGPTVYLYTINSAGIPAASPVTAGPVGNVPFGFGIDNEYMVLSDAAPFGGSGGVIPVRVNGTTDTVSFAANYTVLNTQKATCWVTWNPLNSHFYTSNTLSASITELSRDGSDISIINTYTIGDGNSTNQGTVSDASIMAIGGTGFLFVSSGMHVHILQLGTNTASVLQSLNMVSNGIANVGMGSYTIPSSATTSIAASSGPLMIVTFIALALTILF